MQDLLLHPSARFSLLAYAKQPPHALLLLGPEGMGKSTVAKKWATSVTKNQLYTLEPDEKGTITIEAIRHLYTLSRNKQTTQQVIFIDHAEAMSSEAQNAFLKLLEEPVHGITFLLTAPSPEAVLPTILSRVQSIWLYPLGSKTLQDFFIQQRPEISQQEIAQLLFIAQGRAGTAAKLLQDAHYVEQERTFMQQAKELLSASPHKRYQAINKLNDRNTCLSVLYAMLYISNVQLTASQEKTRLRHWINLTEALQVALERITHNGNVKAQLLKLFASW